MEFLPFKKLIRVIIRSLFNKVNESMKLLYFIIQLSFLKINGKVDKYLNLK